MRSIRQQPFCWQEKDILRLIRKSYRGSNNAKLRNLYLTVSEIDSDTNGRSIANYTAKIATYSGLSREYIPKGLKNLQKLGIIEISELRDNLGKFIGKIIIFTPQNINLNTIKAVNGKAVNGKPIKGQTDTIEHNTTLEHNNFNRKKNNSALEFTQRNYTKDKLNNLFDDIDSLGEIRE